MDATELTLARALAANLRALRQSRGWTQAELAEHAGISPHYVALLETTRKLPTLKSLGSLARSLGVGAAELLATGPGEQDSWTLELTRLAGSVREELRPLVLNILKTVARSAPPPRAAQTKPVKGAKKRKSARRRKA